MDIHEERKNNTFTHLPINFFKKQCFLSGKINEKIRVGKSSEKTDTYK